MQTPLLHSRLLAVRFLPQFNLPRGRGLSSFLLGLMLSSSGLAVQAQTGSVSINTDGSTADLSAMLEVKSTTQGVLIPRMTAQQRNLIGSPNPPATGLLVYQTDAPAGFYFYNGTAWTSLSASGTPGPQGPIGPQGPAGQGVPVGGTTGQVLSKINGTDYNTQWTTPSGGAGAGVITVLAVSKNTDQTTSVGNVITDPEVITFENVTTSVASSIGSWNIGTSTFTVGTSGAGWYLLDLQLTINLSGVFAFPMIELGNNSSFNGITGANNLYGTGAGSNTVLQTPYRGRAALQRVIYLNDGDRFRVRASSSSTVVGAVFNGDATCYLKVVKLN